MKNKKKKSSMTVGYTLCYKVSFTEESTWNWQVKINDVPVATLIMSDNQMPSQKQAIRFLRQANLDTILPAAPKLREETD